MAAEVCRKELQPLQEGLAEVRAAVATKASAEHAQEGATALQDLSRRLDEAMVRMQAISLCLTLGRSVCGARHGADAARLVWCSCQASVHSTLESHSSRFDVVARSVNENAAVGALQSRLDSTLSAVEARLAQMESDVQAKAWVTSVETSEQQLVALGASCAALSSAPVPVPLPVPLLRQPGARGSVLTPRLLPHPATSLCTCAAARNEDLQRQVDIALRFVEWFSRRGEAYEHNAAAIERHMKDLALTAHSRRAGVPHCDTVGAGHSCHGGAGCKCGCGGGGAGRGHGDSGAESAGRHGHGHSEGGSAQGRRGRQPATHVHGHAYR